MEITYTKNIPDSDIANLLDSAGRGSSYWASETNELEYESMTKGLLDGSKTLMIRDEEADEPKEYTLDLEGIKRGLQVMADKFPKHFADFLSDNGDDITGDVFLQCALLGDIIYG